MLSAIAELDEFKGAWRAISRIAPERLSSLRRVATVESVGSSTRIEGAKLSDAQVEALLRQVDTRGFDSRDEQEAAGYADAMEIVSSSFDAIDLTENHIRQLHRDLLRYSAKDERHRGAYKTVANNVEAFGPDGERLGVIFETATPFDTPRRMEELVSWTRAQTESRALHPLLVVAIFVVVFLEIHPFEDGNGRLSRILTTLLLLRAGYAYVPYSSLEHVIEQSRDGYYLSLRRTQVTIRSEAPDWRPWMEYFLAALRTQKRRLEEKIDRETALFGAAPELSARILEHARQHGRISVREAVRITGASRNTIKGHIRAMVDQGHLELRGAGRGAWYSVK